MRSEDTQNLSILVSSALTVYKLMATVTHTGHHLLPYSIIVSFAGITHVDPSLCRGCIISVVNIFVQIVHISMQAIGYRWAITKQDINN